MQFGRAGVLHGGPELRVDFRTFRLDRIGDLRVEEEKFRPEPGKTLKDFLARDDTWLRGKPVEG